ncbi:hypothetical protein [Methylosinus sp. PW1]|uniref:hypothetical protein n=1 Tax=Methylosinus sp. PW1 TaxID=107636 RepID=UPI0005642C63|nr:hypothetical protein [Methylosinus sp. PW1]
MQYTELRGVSSHYSNEVGTSGLRTEPVVWSRIQNRLREAILELKTVETELSTAANVGTTMKDRIGAFEKSSKRQKFEMQRTILQKRIAELRSWLSKEGASADADGNVEMANMGALKVVYDTTAAQQGLTRVYVNGGRLFHDALFRRPFSTKSMVTHFSGLGKGVFVMSQEGNIHIHSHIVGHYHHSSLLGGGAVACAGEIEVDNGLIKSMSNKSGHYIPDYRHLHQIFHQLKKKGVGLHFPISVFGYADGSSPTTAKKFDSAQQFLDEMKTQYEIEYENLKLLAYWEHLVDSKLGERGWRYRDESKGEKVGVYVIATNHMVPHKEARAWLKLKGYRPETTILAE